MNAASGSNVRIVSGKGVRYTLDDGREVLDASNTAGVLGHAHPAMVAAIRSAASNAPAINEGWIWDDREQAAEDLIQLAFGGHGEWVGGVRFFVSGSEANDAALSLSQALTGRKALATRERAYHGMVGLARDLTVQPHWHGGLSIVGARSQTVPKTVPVRILPAPNSALYESSQKVRSTAIQLASVGDQLADVAATIIDYTQGGIYYDAEYQDLLASAIRDADSLWIADEVVTGLGRMGRWFAFEGGRSRPDIVTLGKSLGGGAAPVGAVVVSKDLMKELGRKSWQTYSTFRGHPMCVAAVRAYLRVVSEDGWFERVHLLEDLLKRRLLEIAHRHSSVRRIDGRGLHWTIELHGPDWRIWEANDEKPPIASQVANAALQAGVLIGTSGEQTSLFLAPPLIMSPDDLEKVVCALDYGLSSVEPRLYNN